MNDDDEQERAQRSVERAFPEVARFLAGERTVTVETVDHGEITIPEPDWCIGHDWQPNPHRADITHNGPTVVATVETDCHGEVEFLQTHLSWAPFGELQPQPYPVLAIEVDAGHDFDPDGVRRVASALLKHVGRLHRFADELELLREATP